MASYSSKIPYPPLTEPAFSSNNFIPICVHLDIIVSEHIVGAFHYNPYSVSRIYVQV